MMRICSQLELVPFIFWRMVNTPRATGDLQPINTAPLTKSLKNSVTESNDIYRIREYSTLSIGLRFNSISLGSDMLPNRKRFWLEHRAFESIYLVHYPFLWQFLPQFWDRAKIRIIDLFLSCYEKNSILVAYQTCKIFVSNNDPSILVH